MKNKDLKYFCSYNANIPLLINFQHSTIKKKNLKYFLLLGIFEINKLFWQNSIYPMKR